MVWFIDDPRPSPQGGWHVHMFEGEDDADSYDKVVRLTLEPMPASQVHDQVLLEIDRMIGWRESQA